MIEVRNLTKRFRSKVAVNDLTFSVEKGEILGFLGPNGAGKTTTMRMLTGFMPATSGNAIICGLDVFEKPHEIKKRVGYLPENPPLYRDMTVEEYLDFIASIKGMSRREKRQRIGEIIEQLNLQEVRNLIISKLSKGFRQRVGLAQALIHKPEVLILDEPTSGLDPRQVVEVRKLITDLAGEHTIILSTHILPEVSMTCQRVIIIDRGRMVAVDAPDRLKSRLDSHDKLRIDVAGPSREIHDALLKLKGVQNVSAAEPPGAAAEGRTVFLIEPAEGTDVRDDLLPLLVERGWKLYELRNEGLTLEEIFIRLTTRENREEGVEQS